MLNFDRFIANNLPGNWLKDFYPRAMRRLAEYGFFNSSFEAETKFGFRMLLNRSDSVKWTIHYYGLCEPQICRAWWNFLEPGDYVLDIGGNIGFHALLAGQAVGPLGRVMTFEPMEKVFGELSSNIKLNNMTQVEAKQFAVSDSTGKANIYNNDPNQLGSSSLFPTQPSKIIDTVDCITVEKISEMIDLSKIRLIKIDVEGAEELVLRGFAKFIPQLNHDCVIFVEIAPQVLKNSSAFLAPFFEAGFFCKAIRNEYTTAFYRNESEPEFFEFSGLENAVCDVVLSRNEGTFKKMATPRHWNKS